MLPELVTTRYVTPLREGGSLPALAEANDGKLYVIKFRGAGQGRKALVAEIIAGEIARALGLNVPPLALVALDESFGKNELDPEIQDLLRASAGLNLGLEYLPGALMFDPLAETNIDSRLAAKIVWLDALVLNVDRTIRNPNLLYWRDQLWLIDHGAAFYFHHNWANESSEQALVTRGRARFALVQDHVLLPFAQHLEQVDAELAVQLTPERLKNILAAIPDLWLENEMPFETADRVRNAYLTFLVSRLTGPREFFKVL